MANIFLKRNPQLDETINRISEYKGIAIANYMGISVEEDSHLREATSKNDGKYCVYKPSILKDALEKIGKDNVKELEQGPTAVLLFNDKVTLNDIYYCLKKYDIENFKIYYSRFEDEINFHNEIAMNTVYDSPTDEEVYDKRITLNPKDNYSKFESIALLRSRVNIGLKEALDIVAEKKTIDLSYMSENEFKELTDKLIQYGAIEKEDIYFKPKENKG